MPKSNPYTPPVTDEALARPLTAWTRAVAAWCCGLLLLLASMITLTDAALCALGTWTMVRVHRLSSGATGNS